MRKIGLLIMAVAVVGLMSSCKMKTYYQLMQSQTMNDQCRIESNAVIHDGEYCTVSYNFFSPEGDGGFWFTNNSDSLIVIDLAETFFVVNGVAQEYFQDRQWTQTRSQMNTLSYQASEGRKERRRERRRARHEQNVQEDMYNTNAASAGVSYTTTSATVSNERRYVVIPPHSTKHIAYEYTIWANAIKACGLKETPRAGKPVGVSYTEVNSPIHFSNFITYRVGPNGPRQYIDDRFFVSNVMNVRGKAMFEELRLADVCGKPTGNKVKRLRYNTPDRFYVIYRK